jgi:L-ascorbate metabolism protein UlaG (beta-lactamase superfamily)
MFDHFNGRTFFNPDSPARRRPWEVLRWMATRRKQPWPRWVEDRAWPGPPAAVGPDQVAVTFVNHSTFLLQTDGVNLLTDPVWSERVSPLTWAGPRRVRRPGLAFERLPEVHLVLVSHNHYDHMDLATLGRLEQRFRPRFLTGLGNRRYLTARGLGRVDELDWWQSTRVGAGLEVTLTPAQHFSARSLLDRDRTLWGGFGIRTATRAVFFAGDSGYAGHFREIGRRWPGLDLALLPIGAYEPRWFMKEAHMNPEEAVQAHLDLAPRQSLAMHFGTFQLTDEPIDEPVLRLRAVLRERGLDERAFRVPACGETVLVPAPSQHPRAES